MGGRGGPSGTNIDGKEDKDGYPEITDKDTTESAREKVKSWLDKNKVYVGTIVDSYGGEMDDAYKITKDGVTFYFGGATEGAARTAMGIFGKRRIPAPLANQVEDVILWAGPASPDPQMKAYYEEGQIWIYKEEGLNKAEMAHELAHGLADRLYGNTSPPEWSDYYKAATSGEKGLTQYASKGIHEDWAEAWRMYAEDREWLKRNCPKRHKVLWRIAHDPRYKG